MFGNMPFNGAQMVTGTGVAFPANSWIFGRINSFTLTSGTVRAYRKG